MFRQGTREARTEARLERALSGAPANTDAPSGLWFDFWFTAFFAVALVFAYSAFLLVVVPLQYFVYLVTAAPARVAFASQTRVWYQMMPNSTAVTEAWKWDAKPDGATNPGFRQSPWHSRPASRRRSCLRCLGCCKNAGGLPAPSQAGVRVPTSLPIRAPRSDPIAAATSTHARYVSPSKHRRSTLVTGKPRVIEEADHRLNRQTIIAPELRRRMAGEHGYRKTRAPASRRYWRNRSALGFRRRLG